ncbi:MAG TPA: hypothetical protein VMR18_00605 [Candidatus Saccharimonadales bacterium]|nr:hypothetical protein [Candidatus Saccharimonadales bacterium]
MSELFCPKFGRPCKNAQCVEINKPIKDAIPETRRALGGVSWSLVRTVLSRNLQTTSDQLCVDLYPSFTQEDTRICPIDALEGEIGYKLGIVVAEQALAALVEKCVADTVDDLRPHKVE